MNKLFIILLFTLFCTNLFYSQDLITLKNSEDIKAKVIEVTPTELKFKRFDNIDGPLFTLLKSEILIVRYENGTKDVFNSDKNDTSIKVDENIGDFFIKGQTDASKFYKEYKGAGTGTLITGLVSPIVGLIPAIACSSTTPKDLNLGYPNSELMKNSDYYNGYTQKAKKIKQGKVWKNWGIALGVNLVAAIVLLN